MNFKPEICTCNFLLLYQAYLSHFCNSLKCVMAWYINFFLFTHYVFILIFTIFNIVQQLCFLVCHTIRYLNVIINVVSYWHSITSTCQCYELQLSPTHIGYNLLNTQGWLMPSFKDQQRQQGLMKCDFVSFYPSNNFEMVKGRCSY